MVDALKDRVWREWCKILNTSGDRPLMVEFAMGGLLSVIGALSKMSPDERAREFAKMPVREVIDIVLLRRPSAN